MRPRSHLNYSDPRSFNYEIRLENTDKETKEKGTERGDLTSRVNPFKKKQRACLSDQSAENPLAGSYCSRG